jgi:hypothetical protein
MNEKNETNIPNDHVVGVISGGVAAQTAQSELAAAGFGETEMLQGEEAAITFDAKGEHSNIVERLVKGVQEHFSEEPNYLAQYEEEARRGNTVVAVKVESRDEADAVKEILDRHGGRNIRYFGKLSVADLSPESNPSARSEESPEPSANT